MKEYVQNIAPGIFLQELLSKPGTVGAVCPGYTAVVHGPTGGYGSVDSGWVATEGYASC